MDEPVVRLRIDSLAHGGDGVGRDEHGRVVFIPGTCPGDSVTAVVHHEAPRFARARLLEIDEPSPDRVDPVCPYFGACGGCQWQHVDYDAQLRAKRDTVVEALGRIGGVADATVREIIASPEHYGYRNRVELLAEPGPPLAIGYAPLGGGDVVEVDTCDLLPGKHRSLPRKLAGALRFLQGRGDLGLARVGVRQSRTTGSLAVDVWTEPGPAPRAIMANTLAEGTGADTISRVVIRPEKGPRAIRGVETLSGSGAWSERLAGFDFTVSPTSFFQVNTAQAERLVESVLEGLVPSPGEVIYDVYAGVGTFTLPLARAGATVTAIEAAGSAVRDLRDNLERAGVDADVAPGDAARVLSVSDDASAAVVDPPRAGLSPDALQALAATGPERIAYVSCDPATFARDTARLAEAGYGLASVTPVDLYPQTYHVEVVGHLFRR
jgi:23S rRNA (uracil1939-C5)-methyltransferase